MSKLPVAACAVLLRDGAVLAVSRRDNPCAYGLPGGMIEPGETPEAAAVRELEEETGFKVLAEVAVPVYDGLAESGRLVRTYLVPDPGGDIVQRGEGVVVWAGWPALITGPFGRYNAAMRSALLELPEQWALQWGSGTLRRAIEERLAWRDLYHHERAAFEFGYGFQAVLRSRLTTGRALAEGDHPGTTETCWWARALRWRSVRDRRPVRIEVVHARLDDGDRGVQEGIAILCDPEVRPPWLLVDRVLVAFTTEAPNGQVRTVNPC